MYEFIYTIVPRYIYACMIDWYILAYIMNKYLALDEFEFINACMHAHICMYSRKYLVERM